SDQAQARGLAGDKSDRGQLLVPVTPRPAGEFAGVAIGVAGLDIPGNDDMVADRHVVVADRLALSRDAREIVRCREGSADRRTEAKLHLSAPAKRSIPAPTLPAWKRPGYRSASARSQL